MLLESRKKEGVSTEEELRHMVEFLNEKAFGESGSSRLELRMHDRPDLDGVLAFIVLVQGGVCRYRPENDCYADSAYYLVLG